MNFTCNRKLLYEKLINIQRTVSTKSVMPVIEGILIKASEGKVYLASYDLDLGTTTEMEANVTEEGTVVIKAKLLVDVISKLPNDLVHIQTDASSVTTITCSNVVYKLMGISGKDFPELPTFREKTKIRIKALLLQDMIKKVRYAISDNMQKPVYTGALFDVKDKSLNIVAVDGFRMAVRHEMIDIDDVMYFIVPGKTLNEVLRYNVDEDDYIELSVGDRRISFTIGGYCLISRLIDGIFINYEATIPQNTETEFTVNKNTMLESIERVYIVNVDKFIGALACELEENEMKMFSSAICGSVNESMPIKLKGKPLKIGFNSKYLLDALKNCDTDEIKMEFNGPRNPLKISPLDGKSFTHIVLPMRMS